MNPKILLQEWLNSGADFNFLVATRLEEGLWIQTFGTDPKKTGFVSYPVHGETVVYIH